MSAVETRYDVDDALIPQPLHDLLEVVAEQGLDFELRWSYPEPLKAEYPDRCAQLRIQRAEPAALELLLEWQRDHSGRDVRVNSELGLLARYSWISGSVEP